jgi:hypothetical protein
MEGGAGMNTKDAMGVAIDALDYALENDEQYVSEERVQEWTDALTTLRDQSEAERLRELSIRHGFAAVRAGDQDWGSNDSRTSAVDTIANVLHWITDSEPTITAESVIDSAVNHYEAETPS